MATLFDKDIDSKFFGAESNEWLGIVLATDSQEQQIKGIGGYGYRRRVAIMGHHPSTQEIKDSNIVFALVQLGVTDGTGAKNRDKKIKIEQGDVVIGKFLDNAKQVPLITGVLGRTEGIKYGKGRFDIKSGYSKGDKKLPLTYGDESTGDKGFCAALGIVATPNNKRKSGKNQLKKAGLQGGAEVGAISTPKLNPKDIFNVLKENPDINLESITSGLTEELGDLPDSLSKAFSDPSSLTNPTQFFNVGEAGSFLKDNSLLNKVDLEQLGQVFKPD